MLPLTLLGVLDHIMSVEVESNASVSFARQKDTEERSLKRRERYYNKGYIAVVYK